MPRFIAYAGIGLIVAGVSWAGDMMLTLIATGIGLIAIATNESNARRHQDWMKERERQRECDREWLARARK